MQAAVASLISAPLATLKKYERHLSALSMLGGFAFDNYIFGRIDHPATMVVLFTYLSLGSAGVVLLHVLQSRSDLPPLLRRLRPLFLAATQFLLGGLWSAQLVFYGRSAVIAASWPFLAVLAAMLIGNEMFRDYHSRLVLTCTLLFFAFLSCAIFLVPVFTGTMGPWTFLLSGAIAVGAFALVLLALYATGRERMRSARLGIFAGALGVLGVINLSYFASILPPLPLSLAKAGVFHSVAKVGDVYEAMAEPSSWSTLFGAVPSVHIEPGKPVSVYSAVFAPIQLRTNVVHVWQRYDEARGAWRTESTVAFRITGGREGGYRGYSVKSNPRPGRWRVAITTPEGLLIGRVAFSLFVGSAAATEMQIIR